MSFQVLDPEYESRVRASFSRQKAMTLIGASLGSVAPGRFEVDLPFRDELTQQRGYVHGGILGMIADVARAEVYSEDGRHVASMQQTLMMLADTPDTPE